MELNIKNGQIYNDHSPIRILFVEQFGFNHFLDNGIFKVLDTFAACGVNGFRVFGFWPYGQGKETEPYVRLAPKHYNLCKFNQDFFDYQRAWVETAERKGIVVLYELFDRCGLTSHTEEVADYHPYQVLVHKSEKTFSDMSNEFLLHLQKAYVQKVLNIIAGFPNVILGVMNEFQGCAKWHRAISKFIKLKAPEMLLSGSEETSSALMDPRIDLWWVHTGKYNFKTSIPAIASDIAALRKKTKAKVLGYSTDGFGQAKDGFETPENMAALAQDAKDSGLQLLGFLDRAANEHHIGQANQLSTPIYQVMVNIFKPTSLK